MSESKDVKFPPAGSALPDFQALPAETAGERWAKYGSNVLLTSIIVIVLAVVLVWGAQHQRIDKRVDLTVNNSQSLKPQTVNILKELKQPIRIVGLYARLKSNQVGQEQDYYTPVVDLLDRYHQAGKDVQVEMIDPVNDPAKLDAWLGEVTRKYGGNIKAYRDVLTQFPATLAEIGKIADEQAKGMQALREVQFQKEDQAETINEAYSTVRTFPTLLSAIDQGIKQELEKKIPDYKGQVDNVRASMGTFSRQVEGVQKDLQQLEQDQTAPQKARDYAKGSDPRFAQMKKLADDLLAKIKTLGELKLDDVRRQITDPTNENGIRSIAVEGEGDLRILNFGQVWKSGETTNLAAANQGPARLRFDGERQITSAILALQNTTKPKVAFVRGGGPPLTNPMFTGQAPFTDIADRLRSYNFDVVEKDLSGEFAMQMMARGGGQMGAMEPTDEEIKDAVWIVFPMSPQMSQMGPKPVSPEVIKKLNDHLESGGSALFMFEIESDPLGSVLKSWGISPKTSTVCVHEAVPASDQGSDDFVEMARRQPPIFVLNEYGDSPITKTLQTLDAALVPMLPIQTDTVPDCTVTKILPVPHELKSWGESDLSFLRRGGKPPTFDPGSADMDQPLWAGAVAEKKGKGRVVVIGNAGFISNQLLSLLDPKLEKAHLEVARFPGNGELFTNSVFWLSHKENMIALSPSALDTSRIPPIGPGALNFWRIGVLLIGMPLLAVLAGLGVYQTRKD